MHPSPKQKCTHSSKQEHRILKSPDHLKNTKGGKRPSSARITHKHEHDRIERVLSPGLLTMFPTPGEAAQQYLDSLREIGSPDTDRFLENRGLGHASVAVAKIAGGLALPDVTNKSSLQYRLLHEISGGDPRYPIWAEWADAQKAARDRLFALARQMLFGNGSGRMADLIRTGTRQRMGLYAPGLLSPLGISRSGSGSEVTGSSAGSSLEPLSMNGVLMLRLLEMHGRGILSTPEFRWVMDQELRMGNGQKFVQDVDHKLARSREKNLGVNETHLQMARNWTNPDLPLWLATREAMAQILRHVFGLEDVGEAGVEKERSRHLSAASAYPIRELRSFKTGRTALQIKAGRTEWSELLSSASSS